MSFYQADRMMSGRHFRVVRFYTDFAIGVVREVLGANLTYNEARDLILREREELVPGEETLIEDETKQGLEAMVTQPVF